MAPSRKDVLLYYNKMIIIVSLLLFLFICIDLFECTYDTINKKGLAQGSNSRPVPTETFQEVLQSPPGVAVPTVKSRFRVSRFHLRGA